MEPASGYGAAIAQAMYFWTVDRSESGRQKRANSGRAGRFRPGVDMLLAKVVVGELHSTGKQFSAEMATPKTRSQISAYLTILAITADRSCEQPGGLIDRDQVPQPRC
jgi:hypothetical protein